VQLTLGEITARIAGAPSWDERVEEIRQIPEFLGQAQHQAAYAAVATAVYKPHLAAQFAYVQWRDDYELGAVEDAYIDAHRLTEGFVRVDPDNLAETILDKPKTLRIFRLIIGYTTSEFAVAASEAGARIGLTQTRKSRIDAIEAGSTPSTTVARSCAEAIHLLMTNVLWDVAAGDFRSKLEKPDTEDGWETVRKFAREGVPYQVLLHQRHYGGPFRTLLDATSSGRGDILETPFEDILQSERIPYIRTGAHNQAEVRARFGLSVRPAPDFVIFEGQRTLRAMVECKQANDGGTARDKAARFTSLAAESRRLGGVPLFAILDGLGWQRVRDALGPVVRDTDGRVFSLANLAEILEIQPFSRLRGTA
jgi:hypothetical protein